MRTAGKCENFIHLFPFYLRLSSAQIFFETEIKLKVCD